MWITWGPAKMSDFYAGKSGLVFFIFLLFDCQLIAFSYACSYMFTNPKSCIAFLPFFIIFLVLLPNICILLIFLIFSIALKLFTISSTVQAGVQLWGIMILSPHGALFSALLATTQNFDAYVENYPPVGATIAFMIVETILFMWIAYYVDSNSIARLDRSTDPTFNAVVLNGLDEDVKQERERAMTSGPNDPLFLQALRKVFPPKRPNGKPLIAVEDVQFSVTKGEIFGLLGANGAGKTTTLSMLTRHLIPTSGEAFIGQASILSSFAHASKNLGVVTQNNSLWDLLSVEDHLYLFARLRGVPSDLVKAVVEGTIDQLELTPHRKKLAERLSGGMKRKLCVAIALIGDPQVVLLDEPSAGLDPVSRRNLWTVILKTMSHRSVVLTTHSMEEAEALCARIGIMVKGQIRVLGTKQHLKSKYSSGYELVVKLHVHAETFDQQVSNLTAFVTGLFSEAKLISENGGLITYRVPKEQMKVGKSFTAFEKSKESLDIEDYSISQPTLEQVFIQTVLDNSETRPALASIGGGYRSSVEGLGILDPEQPAAEESLQKLLCNYKQSEFDRDINLCGCSNFQMKIMIIITLVLFLIFAAVSIVGQVGILFVLAIITLVISIVGCVLLWCPCCKKTTGLAE
jgi:ABC-type multidrug transport system ATPase subunit